VTSDGIAGLVALLGKLEADTITAYIKRATLFLNTNTIAEDKGVLTLLLSIGKEIYEILRNLLAPKVLREASWNEIIETLKAHIDP